MLTVAALLLLAGGTGCHGINLAQRGGNHCDQCGLAHGGRHGNGGNGAYANATGAYAGQVPTRGTPGVPHHLQREYNGPPGPPTAQVGYPYYTTRGPRDFFVNNPPDIGP
jgi:hypothetical protein